ncbi:MAG: CRISPR-associated endoribonuclease Cas6 [Candidatus Brockarchaeota archaeon]|nr:CRISPR-associated endoribonuclease Cas6 [Candidatus Brockarchaeota archaeon]
MENEEQRPIVLPIGYNHLVQAAIYNSISPRLSIFLHDRGFLYGKRSFKLFTFSRLMGEYEIKQRMICFNNVGLYISSPVKRFVKELANTLLKKGFMIIGENKLKITSLYFPPEPKIESRTKIRSLSPITVYSTLISPDGGKKTYYYSPFEDEFSKIIDANAKKKLYILRKRVIKSNLEIKVLSAREKIIMYKDTVVKGWMGLFEIIGRVHRIPIRV